MADLWSSKANCPRFQVVAKHRAQPYWPTIYDNRFSPINCDRFCVCYFILWPVVWRVQKADEFCRRNGKNYKRFPFLIEKKQRLYFRNCFFDWTLLVGTRYATNKFLAITNRLALLTRCLFKLNKLGVRTNYCVCVCGPTLRWTRRCSCTAMIIKLLKSSACLTVSAVKV